MLSHNRLRPAQSSIALNTIELPSQLAEIAAANSPFPDSVRPWEMVSLLKHFGPEISTLSLDCFDTVLWRNTRAPVDVFFDLQNGDTFKKHGLSAKMRVIGEGRARNRKLVVSRKSEVTLQQIYRTALPDLSEQELEELCQAEIAAEIAACFPFPHAVDLILAAKRRGLQIIIVSDTYLVEEQLRTLLQSKLPQAAYQAIDHVFCSSATGRSKSKGLFTDVLEKLRIKPARIFHLGDNPTADLVSPRRKGIASTRLVQFENHVSEHLRMTATGSSLLHPQIRHSQGLCSPYHGLLSYRPQPQDGCHALGYVDSGPIFFGFAHFIKAQIESLKSQNKQVKPVFLMRDGYLPQLVFDAVFPENEGVAISISRFAAYASSFRTREQIEEYLGSSAGSRRFETMLKQLLVPEKMWGKILKRASDSAQPEFEFITQVLKAPIVEVILTQSLHYRTRLYRYLERTTGLRHGDTLLFVDLGYGGTAQRCLGPMLKADRNVEVRGCYLLASATLGWQKDRAGLLDPSWCDNRTLGCLIQFISVLENISTAQMESVVDYSEEGEPIGNSMLIAQAQIEKVIPVQKACVQFAQDAESFFVETGARPTTDQMRIAALGALARIIFFPSLTEVDFIDGFSLDLGMGTSDELGLFDRELGLIGLQKRGLFFAAEEQTSLRINYPFELRSAGLELSLTLLAQQRFGLDIASNDLTFRTASIDILAVKDDSATTSQAEARATYDGCFALAVPVGACDFDVGFLFGTAFRWIQLVSCDLMLASHLIQTDGSSEIIDLMDSIRLEGVEHPGDQLLHFENESSFVFVSPRAHKKSERHFAIRLVFRPLSKRSAM